MTETNGTSGAGQGLLAPDLAEAQTFLRLLDPTAAEFTFQTFVDRDLGHRGNFAHVRHGDLEQLAPHLTVMQGHGCGVFVTVNETDLKGRKATNVTRVRTVFVDLDGAPIEPVMACKLSPHVTVESSPGKYHAYWLVDGLPLDQFQPVQKAIIKRFGGDKSVHDLPRVMRLPGFWHQKAEPFRTRILWRAQPWEGPPEAIPPWEVPARYTAEQVLAEFQPATAGSGPQKAAAAAEDHEDLRELVRQILAAENFHDPLVRLAWRYLSDGMSSDKVVETLQGLMQAADGPHDERWQARYDDIPRAVSTAEEKRGGPTRNDICREWLKAAIQPRVYGDNGQILDANGVWRKLTDVHPDPQLIDQLMQASDHPKGKRNPSRDAVERCVSRVLRIAWGSLRSELPDERSLEASAATADAIEELRRDLMTLLCQPAEIQYGIGRTALVTQLYQECSRHRAANSTPGATYEPRWMRLASWPLWGYLTDDDQFLIAFQEELARITPIKVPAIANLKKGMLTKAVNRCGFGASGGNRGPGKGKFRATVVDSMTLPELPLIDDLSTRSAKTVLNENNELRH
jgi:hypothetical protein